MIIDARSPEPLPCGCIPWQCEATKDGKELMGVVRAYTGSGLADQVVFDDGGRTIISEDGVTPVTRTIHGVTVKCQHGEVGP